MRLLCARFLLPLPALVFSDNLANENSNLTEHCSISSETKVYLTSTLQKKLNQYSLYIKNYASRTYRVVIIDLL